MNTIHTEPINQLLAAHMVTAKPASRFLHLHNNAYEIMLFKSGNVDYFINNITYHLKPGDMTLICPNDIHGFFTRDASPYERYPVHIEEALIHRLSTDQTNLCECFHNLKPDRVYPLTSEQIRKYEYYTNHLIWEQEQRGYGNDIKKMAYLAFLLVLVNKAFQRSGIVISDISPPLIRNAISYIDRNLTNPITIQTISDALNISRSRISHLFKDYTGISLWNYIIIRRIQHAQMLLQHGSTITEACYDSGFQDYAHFNKVFAKVTGLSPGRYIKNKDYQI